MKKIATLLVFVVCLLHTVTAQVQPASVTVYKRDTAFSCIAVDGAGDVYAGTNAKGLWKFEQNTWKNWNGFGTAFWRSNLRQIATTGNDVWVASSGYVLFLGSGEAGNNNNYWGGMHKINGKLPIVRTYYRGRPVLGQQSLSAQGPPTRNVLGLCIDNTGAPWCAASYHDSITYPAFLNYNDRYHFAPGAVGKFNGTNFSFITGPALPDPTGILIGVGNNYQSDNYSFGKRRTCRSITQVGNEMWVGSDGYEKDAATIITAGILRYGLDGTYIGKYDQNNTPVPFGLTNSTFGPWAMYKDVQGRVWISMNGSRGIAVFDNTGWHHLGVPPILPANTIFRANGITGNANGEVFFGTGNGLLVYKGSGSYTDAASYSVYTTAQKLSSNVVNSIAIGKNEELWIATDAGVNKIERGDLFVYNRKPNHIIITDKESQRIPVLHYDSRMPQSVIDNETLLISADGGRGAIFKWSGASPANVKFRFAEDPAGYNPDEFGSFSVQHRDADSVRVLFTHPKFVDEVYTVTNTDGGRTVRLQVVDTTVSPAQVLMSIPVKFVLPPVLMVHGVWSSIESFKNVEAALLASFQNYKPYRLLRIWYKDDVHPEPVTSQYAYRYKVPDGIAELIENCAANKMAVGKVDILAHSRGGIFSRIYLQERFVNYRNDINKLITLNTPHSGSQQANLILDKRTTVTVKRVPGTALFTVVPTTLGKLVSGFVLATPDDINGAEELKVNSPAILTDLNGPGNLNRNTTYSHALIGRQQFGTTTFAQVVNSGLVQGSTDFSLRMMASLISTGITTIDYELQKIFNTEYNDIVVPETSQKGGLIEANVTRFPGINVAHSNKSIAGLPVATGVLDIPQVHFKVADLLRAKSTGGLFATTGFNPQPLVYNYLQPNPPFLSGTAERQADAPPPNFNITIDTALNGKVFKAGDTVTVKVSKRNSDTVLIKYAGVSIDLYSDEHFGNDTVFKFPVPKEAIGTVNIEAYAFNNHQIAYDSAAVIIGVPANVVLDSIKIVHPGNADLITIVEKDSLYFTLNGYYSDSVVRNITYQTPLTHIVEGGNISTVRPNRIKGLIVGFDQLTVTYQGKSDTAFVEVVPAIINPPLGTLPVKFLGITASYTGSAIQVRWSTAQEINNSHFEVEHSVTGSSFTTAGKVAATNSPNGSSYNYQHVNYNKGKNYYRIRQVDTDGKTMYSAIVLVTVPDVQQVLMYPNPVTEQLTISFNSGQNRIKALRIVNTAGQVVHQQTINAGNNIAYVPVANWAPGVYVAELLGTGNKKVFSKEFIKK